VGRYLDGGEIHAPVFLPERPHQALSSSRMGRGRAGPTEPMVHTLRGSPGRTGLRQQSDCATHAQRPVGSGIGPVCSPGVPHLWPHHNAAGHGRSVGYRLPACLCPLRYLCAGGGGPAGVCSQPAGRYVLRGGPQKHDTARRPSARTASPGPGIGSPLSRNSPLVAPHLAIAHHVVSILAFAGVPALPTRPTENPPPGQPRIAHMADARPAALGYTVFQCRALARRTWLRGGERMDTTLLILLFGGFLLLLVPIVMARKHRGS